MKINQNLKLTALIIAHDEEKMIEGCLNCLNFCGQAIVIDNDSTDNTAAIAQKYGARIIRCASRNFSEIRNFAAAHVHTDWLIYVDADERVTPALAREINTFIAQEQFTAAQLKRENYLYGHHFQATGYDNDHVIRLFQKKHFIEWTGQVHETPIFSGQVATLKEPLLHLTHRSTHDNLLKSAEWTLIEAQLLAASPTTKTVTPFTILRKGTMEFYRRYWRDHGRRDKTAGFVESLVQAMNKMMIHIQVWELQQSPSLPARYQRIETQLAKDWSDVEWQLEKN